MLNIVYVSGVKLGYECAEKILDNGYGIKRIFCLGDEFKERSGYVDFSPLCEKHKIPLTKTADINLPENVALIQNERPDVIFVIGWSQIIGEDILKIPKIGIIGHHPTLLPKHRGNAPIPWTLINGLTKSGITFFFLEKKIDDGDILIQKEFDVDFEDNATTVYQKMILSSIKSLEILLPQLGTGEFNRIKQDHRRASIWKKRSPDDGIIDWNSMTIYIYNWIRGLTHPYPGAFTYLDNKKIFIWTARISSLNIKGQPGKIKFHDDKVLIFTGDGAIQVDCLQVEGELEMDANTFIKKHLEFDNQLLG